MGRRIAAATQRQSLRKHLGGTARSSSSQREPPASPSPPPQERRRSLKTDLDSPVCSHRHVRALPACLPPALGPRRSLRSSPHPPRAQSIPPVRSLGGSRPPSLPRPEAQQQRGTYRRARGLGGLPGFSPRGKMVAGFHGGRGTPRCVAALATFCLTFSREAKAGGAALCRRRRFPLPSSPPPPSLPPSLSRSEPASTLIPPFFQ